MIINKEYRLNKLIYNKIKNKNFANSEEKKIEIIKTIKEILNNKQILNIIINNNK